MEKRQSWFERNPKKTYALVLLVMLVGIDWLAGALFIPEDMHRFRTFHPWYHHGLLPNKEAETAWGSIHYPLVTNSLGMRDFSTRNVPLESEKHRILLMGDSHTEAVGMPYSQSLAGRLTTFADSLGIEILNGAAVSYSPKLHFLKTQYLLQQQGLEVDEVFLFLDISDIQNEYAYEHFEPQQVDFWRELGIGLSDFMSGNSFVYFGIRRAWRQQQLEAFYEAVTKQQIERNNTVDLYSTFFSDFEDEALLNNIQFHTTITEWFSDETLYEKWGKKGFALMEENLLRLVELCRKKGVKLTISVHPWRPNIWKGEPWDRHVRHWQQFAGKHQIGFVNLYPVFIKAQGDKEGIVQQCYIEGDNHWNATGHARVAERLKPHIALRSNIPKALKYQYQGDTARDAGNFAQAVAWYAQAASSYPMPSKIHEKLFLANMAAGNWPNAASLFNTLSATLPDSVKNAWGVHFNSQRKLAYLSFLINRQPSDSLWLARGEMYLVVGNYLRAYEDFMAAVDENPQHPLANYHLGRMEFDLMDNPEMAMRYLNRAIQQDDTLKDAYILRAEVFEHFGNNRAAMQDREKAQAISLQGEGN